MVLGTTVGYGSETDILDFGVNQCIIKVKGENIRRVRRDVSMVISFT